MGVRVGSSWSNTVLSTLPASNAETILITPPLLVTAVDGNAVQLNWLLCYQTSSGTTGIVVSIRRGSTLAGPLVSVSPWTATVTGNTTYFWGGCYFDMPGPGLVQYSLTVQQQGSISQVSTINDAGLYAFML